jgi:hypothetical protein
VSFATITLHVASRVFIVVYFVTDSVQKLLDTQRVMAAKLTRLTHKIAIQLHLESCAICSSRSMRPVQKVLDTPSYTPWYLVKYRDNFTFT